MSMIRGDFFLFFSLVMSSWEGFCSPLLLSSEGGPFLRYRPDILGCSEVQQTCPLLSIPT